MKKKRVKLVTKLPTKEELNKLKSTRLFGIKNLKKRLSNIRRNIQVFQQAIDKQRNEMKQIRDMIKVLEKDIKNAKAMKKKLKS